MGSPWTYLIMHAVALVLVQGKVRQVTERHDNGKPSATYRLDARGRKTGKYESWHADGRRFVTSQYKLGQLHGSFRRRSADGRTELVARYASGKLDGRSTVRVDGKPTATRKFKAGLLVDLDGMVPFSRRRAAIRRTIAGIEKSHTGSPEQLAMRELKIARYLSGSPWTRLRLAKPGSIGSRDSLRSDAKIPACVAAFLRDRDVDELESRRRCLDPALQAVAFAGHGDRTILQLQSDKRLRKRPSKDWELICYPPRGFAPSHRFAADTLWSITFHPKKFSRADLDHGRLRMFALDEYYVRGEKLELHTYHVASGAFDSPYCVVFRPRRCSTQPGNRYEVLFTWGEDKGAKVIARYLVEFVGP